MQDVLKEYWVNVYQYPLSKEYWYGNEKSTREECIYSSHTMYDFGRDKTLYRIHVKMKQPKLRIKNDSSCKV